MKARRAYTQSARADQAAGTARRIVDAATELFMTRDFDELTLQAVAQRAGVTLQTVLRRFQSKEGLINAAAAEKRGEIWRARAAAIPGNVQQAVRTLVASYESMGQINWRLLRQEHRFPEIKELLDEARAQHRRWIEATFAPLLPARGKARQRRTLQLFAALDFYQWKLLRIDLDLPRAEVERLIAGTVEAIVSPQGGGRR